MAIFYGLILKPGMNAFGKFPFSMKFFGFIMILQSVIKAGYVNHLLGIVLLLRMDRDGGAG